MSELLIALSQPMDCDLTILEHCCPAFKVEEKFLGDAQCVFSEDSLMERVS